ncbi:MULTISPECIES: helix-turn-helix domain-containing protein [unclassified Streptomyces]|uniref:helix-turn-helix domain-containing protein n=1 Tax=unclassified Streptomyces TaxID=2593676 RepID=UPI001BE5D6C5|nr:MULTISPECIES: helix-turn-helix domain-containing protein [unclassified Streptomyces]MBT2405299.1 DNA-binding protein [Streptomyces sp. ISL-21]MBT2613293.1 DNA-binding protein [Streptomyces sp. ISL-87]
MEDTAVSRNLELQRQWYGAPLGEICRELCTTFGISQSALANVMGISPAMLSLVMRGQRARIANPDAAARLSTLIQRAQDVRSGAAEPSTVAGLLAEIRTQTTPGQDSLGAPVAPFSPPESPSAEAERWFVRSLRNLLTATAGAVDILDAADAVEVHHPGLAEILRTCGAGRTDEAVDLVRRLNALR